MAYLETDSVLAVQEACQSSLETKIEQVETDYSLLGAAFVGIVETEQVEEF